METGVKTATGVLHSTHFHMVYELLKSSGKVKEEVYSGLYFSFFPFLQLCIIYMSTPFRRAKIFKKL